MCLFGCAALALCAVLLLPVSVLATVVVAERMGRLLARSTAARQATVKKAAP